VDSLSKLGRKSAIRLPSVVIKISKKNKAETEAKNNIGWRILQDFKLKKYQAYFYFP